MEGIKFDQEKPDWSLLDLNLIEDVIKVLTYGAKKYDRDNWQKVVEANPHRYFSAAMRHIAAFQKGEKVDSETELSHLAHAQCCLIFLAWHEKQEAKNESSEDSEGGN